MSVIRGLDHVVIAVNALDAAADAWQRLGFTLSPKGVHSATMGTANHTIMLEDDYFELLGLVASTPANENWRRALARGEGLHGIALASASADAARAEFASRGISAGEPMDFSRPVDRPGAPAMTAKFRITMLPDNTLASSGLFVCQHFTREAVWLPELTTHANGARGIVSLHGTAANTDDWARVFGSDAITRDGDRSRVRVGKHTVLLEQSAAPPRLTGITFRVSDLGATRRALATGVLNETTEGLSAGTANGVEVRFVGSSA